MANVRIAGFTVRPLSAERLAELKGKYGIEFYHIASWDVLKGVNHLFGESLEALQDEVSRLVYDMDRLIEVPLSKATVAIHDIYTHSDMLRGVRIMSGNVYWLKKMPVYFDRVIRGVYDSEGRITRILALDTCERTVC